MHKLTIKLPIYQCTCHIIIEDDIEKVINRYVKKNKWDDDFLIKNGSEVHGYAISSGDIKNYYVFYSTHSLTTNYVTHEISHLVDYILEERDVESTGEARAYLTGHISEKVLEFVIKKQLLISKWLKFIQKEELEKKEQKEQRKDEYKNQLLN